MRLVAMLGRWFYGHWKNLISEKWKHTHQNDNTIALFPAMSAWRRSQTTDLFLKQMCNVFRYNILLFVENYRLSTYFVYVFHGFKF